MVLAILSDFHDIPQNISVGFFFSYGVKRF